VNKILLRIVTLILLPWLINRTHLGQWFASRRGFGAIRRFSRAFHAPSDRARHSHRFLQSLLQSSSRRARDFGYRFSGGDAGFEAFAADGIGRRNHDEEMAIELLRMNRELKTMYAAHQPISFEAVSGRLNQIRDALHLPSLPPDRTPSREWSQELASKIDALSPEFRTAQEDKNTERLNVLNQQAKQMLDERTAFSWPWLKNFFRLGGRRRPD